MRAFRMSSVLGLFSLGLVLGFLSMRASADSKIDLEHEGIRKAALDYIEGWYEGSAERMARAVHPELVKRIVFTDEQGKSRVEQMGASKLVANVRGGGGTRTPKAQQEKTITILDRYENAASVKIVASDWIDYLQLAKIDGRWQIVNVLWELKPKAKALAKPTAAAPAATAPAR